MIALLWRKGRGKGSGVHQMTWENGVQGIGGEGVEGESARCVELHVHASALPCMPPAGNFKVREGRMEYGPY